MPEKGQWYFAYGSNMDQAQMHERVGEFRVCLPATLRNYRLVFNVPIKNNPKAGVANIQWREGSIVEGMVYLLSADQLAKLNKFEGAPDKYRHHRVAVEIVEGFVEAIAYIVSADRTKNYLHPTQEYLNHLLAGKDFLSSEYYSKLQRIRTLHQP